jgi:serine/threonine protein kinase/formylglycine-generating enzyme required for sulfatase activity
MMENDLTPDLPPDLTPTPPRPGSSPQVRPVGSGYTLQERIGAGQFGEVFRALAPGGVKVVAVKRIYRPLDDLSSQRELQALELLRALSHTYLLQVHASWLDDRGQLHIAMELAEGSLSERLQECQEGGMKGIPVGELLAYFAEAAEALDYLHQKDVVHRDIKPANLLRSVWGHAKVADFGLARLVEGSLAEGTFCGSLLYMAPEVWQHKVSPHSDQYSLAVTYAELRLGRRIYSGKNQFELNVQHLQQAADLEGLGEAEQQVLRKALACEPDQRYPNCRAFVAALAKALAPPPPPPPPTPPPPAGRLRLTVVAALVIVLSAAAYLVSQRIFPRDTGKALPPQVEVNAPASLRLDAGTTTSLLLHFRRQDFAGPIQVSCPEPPAGVDIPEAELAADDEEVALRVTAGPGARRGVHKLTVSARGDGVKASADLELTVLALPPGCQKDSEKVDYDAWGVPYYKEISRVLADGTRVQFLLVPRKPAGECRDGKTDPVATFYIMRDKVSFGLYRRFASESGKQVPAAVGLLVPAAAPAPLLAVSFAVAAWEHTDRYPVLGLTVEEADFFAKVGLGGLLPTRQQWDKAAGCNERDRGEGPYRGSWDRWEPWLGSSTWGLLAAPSAIGPLAAACASCPGVERLVRPEVERLLRPDVAIYPHGPRPVGTSRDDVSPFGCRDMAGNGYEWTRTLVDRPQEVPLRPDDSRRRVWVVLRGQGFRTPDRPLTYSDLEGTSEKCPYENRLREGSFRVVIEP